MGVRFPGVGLRVQNGDLNLKEWTECEFGGEEEGEEEQEKKRTALHWLDRRGATWLRDVVDGEGGWRPDVKEELENMCHIFRK